MSFWRILRVLCTDVCNYSCVFCHNDGQTARVGRAAFLPLEGFRVVLDAVQGSGIREVQFSGGEPFLNAETIEMIEWTDTATDLELGCATNGQMISASIAERLARTRIKLNLNLPSLDEAKFRLLTGGGSLARLRWQMALLDTHGVEYALNYVLRSGSDEVYRVIDFAVAQSKRLKILPFLDLQNPSAPASSEKLFAYLDANALDSVDLPTARKWFLAGPGGIRVGVKYVDFPCVVRDIRACRQYGEVRLLPDLSIQPCLLNNTRRHRLEVAATSAASDRIREELGRLWSSFTEC